MKISRAIKILQQTLITAGDVQIAFCLETGEEAEIGFFYPDCCVVVGGDSEPDVAAFMHRELQEMLSEECQHEDLPANITVTAVGEEIH